MKPGSIVKYTYWLSNNKSDRHVEYGIVLELEPDRDKQSAGVRLNNMRVLFGEKIQVVWMNEVELVKE